jgi:hypothetical protein
MRILKLLTHSQENSFEVNARTKLDFSTERAWDAKQPILTSTIKAFNFEPHGNPGIFSSEGHAIIKTSSTENEGNKNCRKTFDLQTLFCSFLNIISPKAADLARIGPKFP